MATQPGQQPDKIDPVAPPEVPDTPNPAETPPSRPDEINPPAPDHDAPGRGPDETPPDPAPD